jgi:hypothetical protein
MINHGRTLLLNLPGSQHPGSSYPGEEYVPPDYKAITLTPTLAGMRNLFLGMDVDRAMMNYRLRQLLTMVHSTELGQYLYDLDPRITYWPSTDVSLVNSTTFGSTISLLSGSNTWALTVVGNPAAQRTTRRVFDTWDVTVLTGTSVRIVHRTAPFESVDSSFTVTNGVSSIVSIPNTPFGLTLVPGTGTLPVWALSITIRPLNELIDVYLAMKIAVDSGLDVFGIGEEPYTTLRALWEHTLAAVPYRLGALVVAWIYRAEQLRLAGG